MNVKALLTGSRNVLGYCRVCYRVRWLARLEGTYPMRGVCRTCDREGAK